jgi:flagellin
MGLSINNNTAAFNAYRNLSVTQNDLSKSLEKLSSGFRINRAADDAAGLAISEGLRSQVGGLKQASRNAQDGISVVQTAEGALTESHAILQRMRDLTVQASNTGGLNEDAKKNIQAEMSELKSELTRISDTTKFNGTKLLDGAYDGTFQVGANVGETINVKISTAMGAAGLGVDDVDVTAAAQDGYVAGLKEGDVKTAATFSKSTTASSVDLSTLTALTVNGEDVLADKTAAGIAAAINGNSAAGAAAEVDSDGNLVITATTAGAAADTLAISATGASLGTASEGAEAVLATAADVTANEALASGADQALRAIDTAIASVSTVRAELGAKQNRFDHTIKNLTVATENLSASESRIRDTDMAQEMVSFTRAQILSQAGTSMLAQANQLPQGVLSLLR